MSSDFLFQQTFVKNPENLFSMSISTHSQIFICVDPGRGSVFIFMRIFFLTLMITNFNTIMKFSFISKVFFPLIVLFVFVSCDSYDQWSYCEDQDPIKNVLDSSVVGPEGGLLQTETVKIEIPAGAFAFPQTLKLIQASADFQGYLGTDTSVYFIEGITENPMKSIRFRMRHDEGLGTDEQGIFIFARETDSIVSPAIAQLNNGWLEADVDYYDRFLDEPGKSSSLKSVSSITRILWYKNTKLSLRTNHFRIYFDTSDGTSNIERIGQYLEDAYSKFKELGFEFTIDEGNVFVWKLAGNIYGMLNKNNLTGKNIQVNNIFLNKTESIKVTVAHELFHWIQYEYDYTFYGALKNLWIDEAFAVWSEQLFSSSTPHYPSVIYGNEYEPFEGLQRGKSRLPGDNLNYNDEDLETYHGYGCASLIKYLVRKYGTGYPVKVYKELKNDVHPVMALHKASNYQLASLVWQKYLEDLMMNQLYVHPAMPFHKNFEGINNPMIPGRLLLSTPDTSVAYTVDYPDLSSRVFKVDVDPSYADFDPDITIKFKVDKTTNMEAISIFKISERQIELLGSTCDSIEISNIGDINERYHYIYAMVSNSNFSDSPAAYTNNLPITLTIETGGQPGCKVAWKLDCVMRLITDEVSIDTVPQFLEIHPLFDFAEGQFTGNVYKTHYNIMHPYTDGNYLEQTGSMEVTFNETKDLIVELYLIDQSRWRNYGKDVYYNTELKWTDLPYYKTEDNYTYFGVQKHSVISHISVLKYRVTYTDGTRELIEVLSAQGNAISVIFNGFDDL